MPLYEYHCEACSADVEILVRTANEKIECPECGAAQLTKLLSVPAAHTLGGGSSLPVAEPGNCGKPWCGTGACGRMA